MTKRIIAVFICIVMLFSSLPMSVFAAGNTTVGAVEFKDIHSIWLYKQENGAMVDVTKCNIEDLQANMDSYLVKVNMLNEPGFYAAIESFSTDDNMLTFKLDIDFDVVQYVDGQAKDSITVTYGAISNGVATIMINTQLALSTAGYIPDKERISQLAAYNSAKQVAYANMYKLAPFNDAANLVTDGNGVGNGDVLGTKLIKSVIPLNETGEIVSFVTGSDADKIKSVRVIFADNSDSEYAVTFSGIRGFIADYTIDEKGIPYSFDRYVIAEDEEFISELMEIARGYDYTEDLDPLTSGGDSRLYRDWYNEKTVDLIEKAVYEALSQSENFRFNISAPALKAMLTNELITNGYLKKILYAFNYYYRWYSFKVGTVSAYEVLFTRKDLFKKSMIYDNLINAVFFSGAPLATNNAHGFYANRISSFTGYANIGTFIEYLVSVFTDYDNANDWFTDTYQGIVCEVGVDTRPDIKYRAWDNMKIRTHIILPLLGLAQNSAYIISMPTQLMLGSQNTYIRNPDDEAQHNQLVNSVKNFAAYAKRFYTTAASLTDTSRWNFANISYDHRYAYNVAGARVQQDPGNTTSNFHKYFIEAIGAWHDLNGSAAYADGTDIYWVCYNALPNFSIWTHETGHNQDSRVFLNGKGRRSGGAPEDYADGNTAQGTGDGGMNFNLSYINAITSDVTTNLTPERITGKENFYSYYKEMFETVDYLDYLEAQAFLKLTPAQQAAIGTQVFYPEVGEERQETGDSTTGWRRLTEEDFAAMNLQTLGDLWDNHIVIKSGINGTSSLGTNKYGASGIYERHWYQQHNENGRPDSSTLKQLAWEMAGVGGYDNGYVTYYSGMYKNDLAALRGVIKASNPSWATVGADQYTWKQYKLDRYEYIESMLDDMEYIDSDKLIESYYNAFVIDAEKVDRNITNGNYVRRMAYHFLKRITDDFRSPVFAPEANVIHISTPEQFVSLVNANQVGNFVLDNDIDLSSVTGSEAVITSTFMGKLNGQGHSLYGTDLFIFNAAKHAYFVDVTISNTKRASLVKSATMCELNGVVIDTRKTPIYTVEDFLAMNNKIDETYILMNDIDFSSYTPSSDALIPSNFTGTLLGNDCTLRGLNGAALFAQFNGTVRDLTVENFTNIRNGGDFVNAFAKQTNNAKMYDCTFKNITLSGKHRTAVVCGTDNANSIFENVKVLDSTVTGGDGGFYNAIFIGRKYGGSIKNVYVDGTLSVSATEGGGVVGASHNAMLMKNVVSKVTLVMGKNTDPSGRNLNGGIIGNIYNSPIISNSIYIGQIFGDTYSFTGSTVLTNFTNCFELTESGGLTAVNGENIHPVEIQALTVDYYKEAFDFGDDFWPYERMTSEAVCEDNFVAYRDFRSKYVNGLHKTGDSEAVAALIDAAKAEIDAMTYAPEMTLSENKAAVDAVVAPLQQKIDEISLEKHRIYSAQDFITKIPADLAGTFHIMNDIDFSGITPSAKALITGTFTGKLYGNSYTLSNLTGAALFDLFKGFATEMSIENFKNIRPSTDYVSAFANTTYNSTITDMFFDNITLSGKYCTAVLSGMDGRENANSTFSRINITNASVTGANGVGYCSILCGRKFGGSVSDIYVEGTLTVSGTESGGVLGASQQGVTMKNVISKVDVKMPTNADSSGRKFNGGVVGNVYNTPVITSSIFMGSVTGDTYSFTGSQNKSFFTDCFELEGTGGILAVNGTNIKSVTFGELTKEFYTGLGFDETVWSYKRIAQDGHPMLIVEDAAECEHEYEVESVTPATCVQDGVRYLECVKCGDDITEIITAAGHDYVGVTTEATCTEEGYTVYTCSVCNDHYSHAVSALGHDFSEEWTVDREATCSVEGSKSHHCKRCDATTDVTAIAEKPHTYKDTVTNPTCTADGYTAHTCNVCGYSYTDEIPALGHDFSEEWTVDREATCSVEGSKSRHCKRCDATTDVTAIAKKPHTYKDTVTNPTCTAEGYTTHTCTVCGDNYKDSTVKANGHAYGDWEQTAAATCTKNGAEERSCSVCGAKETVTVSATGHKYSTEWTIDKAATCSSAGSKSHHCTVCGTKGDVTAIAKTPHEYTDSVTAPTCTADGYTMLTCKNCGYQQKEDIKKATGHSDTDSDGYCNVCGAVVQVQKPECSCNCHKSGISNFFWKISNFFHKIFSMKQYRYCDCGTPHW